MALLIKKVMLIVAHCKIIIHHVHLEHDLYIFSLNWWTFPILKHNTMQYTNQNTGKKKISEEISFILAWYTGLHLYWLFLECRLAGSVFAKIKKSWRLVTLRVNGLKVMLIFTLNSERTSFAQQPQNQHLAGTEVSLIHVLSSWLTKVNKIRYNKAFEL